MDKKLKELKYTINKLKNRIKTDEANTSSTEGRHLYSVKNSTIIIQINPPTISSLPLTTPGLGEVASMNGKWSLSK